MKYGIITQEKFWELRQGADTTIANKFNLLQGEKVLIFIGKMSNKEADLVKSIYNCKVYTIYPFLYNVVRVLRFALKKIGMNKFYFLKKPFHFSIFAKLKLNAIVKKEDINTIICEYIWLSDLVLSSLSGVKQCLHVIETHDIQNSLCEQCKNNSKELSIYVKKMDEINILKEFDIVCCVSYPDIEYFKQYLDNLCYLPPIYMSNDSDLSCNQKQLNIGFIGGGAQFNIDAVNWFYEKVFSNIDDVVFNVYGKVCGSLSVKNERVILHGPVDDLERVYLENHIMINPTFIEGGIKTKNIEALSFGKNVITTTQGARGLKDFVDHGFVKICDDPQSFIELTNHLKENLLRIEEQRKEIIALFKENYSPKHIENAEKMFKNSLMAKRNEKN